MKKKLPWDIIISKLRGNLTEEDVPKFEDWVSQRGNDELFQQLQTVWTNVQNKVAPYEPDLEYYWKELSSRINKEVVTPIASDSTHPRSRTISIRLFYRVAVAASILLVLTISGAYYLGRNTLPNEAVCLSYSSMTGKSKVILPDGTEVWLHSNTTLSYNSNFQSNRREVTMDGEAYFSVTHDANKPFIVHSNEASVTVHGTKFNVNAYKSSSHLLVSLYEGSVSMNASKQEVLLKPGQEGLYDKFSKTLVAKNGDVEFAKSWTNEKLRFENKNLRYVCRYMAKWYGTDIIVDPAILDNQSYSFTLSGESLEEVVRILGRINSIEYKFDESNKLTIRPKRN